jgi:hypothetical protein
MAVTAFQFGLFQKSLANKEVDEDSDALKVMLCTSAFTPNQLTMQYKSSITNEVVGTGYVAAGTALASLVVAFTSGTKTTNLDAADVVWAASTITARYAVIYDSTPGTDATRPLISYLDFGADVVSSGGNFTISWDPAGIIAVTVL